MDRRKFLWRALGAGVAAATTKVWLPPVSTALAQPERRVFLPPARGWIVGVDPAAGEDEQVWAWGTDESASGYLARFNRVTTTYDVETFDVISNPDVMLQLGNTVEVVLRGPHGTSTKGVMMVTSVDWSSGRQIPWRLKGIGVEDVGFAAGKPVASVVADRATVMRSFERLWPYGVDLQTNYETPRAPA